MRNVLALAVLGGLAIMPARPAAASAFRVTPIRVDLTNRSSSVLMTLANDSPEELRFQVSAFEWSQKDGTGEMQLAATKDIVFFPTLLSLKPGEERKVRVGKTVSSGPVEKTYRIFFEELPSLRTPESKGAEVRIITKLGVPIFIEAISGKPSGEIRNAALNEGKLAFDIADTGNTHFFARSVRVIGVDAAGKPAFTKQREGWYILTGGFRRYDLDLTPDECHGITSLRIDVDTDIAASKPQESVLTMSVPITKGSCAQ